MHLLYECHYLVGYVLCKALVDIYWLLALIILLKKENRESFVGRRKEKQEESSSIDSIGKRFLWVMVKRETEFIARDLSLGVSDFF